MQQVAVRNYGGSIRRSEYRALRGIVSAPETTGTGNVVLRAGNELVGGGWEQSVYVVLTPDEAKQLAIEIIQALTH